MLREVLFEVNQVIFVVVVFFILIFLFDFPLVEGIALYRIRWGKAISTMCRVSQVICRIWSL